MKLDLAVIPGTFYEVGNGYLLPTESLPVGAEVQAEKKLPISSMFDIYIAQTLDGVRVGFYFVTRFSVRNGGGYLMTYLNNKSEATEVDTVIRNEDLVVFNYPNRGTLAISPKVNQEIENIFLEQ
jgi:hypothetical protein